MGLLHIIWSIIVGFVAGLIARAIMHGPDPMGFLATSALGIVGSFVGGFVGNLLWRPAGADYHPGGFLLSVVGALIVLFVVHHM
jgi:uncharacterized membrane protein YeaQ/YmgE (transglycosylase-associated protein family)